VGDFNLDGRSDLAVANETSSDVTILLGNGSGGFTQPAGSPIVVSPCPTSVAVGDFNLDGKADLAVASNCFNNVTILLGNGSGGFTEAAGSPVSAGSSTFSLAVGDFNLDGRPDLAVANFGSNNVTILLGTGSGGFTQAAGSPVGAGTSPDFVAVGDFNLDGKPDLVVANETSNNVTILLGNGGGGFTQAAGSPIGVGSIPISVAVGDFNLDGKPDLAVANDGSNNVTILLGNGHGAFAQPAGSQIGAGVDPFSVAMGDFNLDGKPDLAVANYTSHDVTILLGSGSGGFAQPAGSPLVVGARPASLVVGDLNLDGKPDLAVANSGSNDVTIQLNTCDASPCGGIGFMQPAGSPIGTGSGPGSVAIGDFNLDGQPDLAVVNFSSNSLTILLGNGSGGFSQASGSPIGTGTDPFTVAVGDFNLDGKPDLAVTNELSDNVTILLGDGNGGFSQAAGSPVSTGKISHPVSFVVGDFNLDGKADLGVANFNSSNVTILLGNGSGGFSQAAGSPVPACCNPVSVAVGDFNLDGKLDLAVAGSNTVKILLGNGAGGFAQPAGSPIGVGTGPFSVTTGDFNLDGKPDLAVANRDSDNVSILLGNGSGGFTEPVGSPFAVGTNPVSVAVGDLNLDGKPDLAVTNSNSGNVTILLGNGNGGFTKPAGSPAGAGSGPVSVAVGDLNHDGKPDLAVANFLSNNLTVLLGSRPLTTITCPASITSVAAASCPIATNMALTYPNPTLSNNCPGVTSFCNPPSGSAFPVGTTTVICTATDAADNISSCSFTVTVFSFCLQDESNPARVVLVNASTGDYIFNCGGVPIASGRGTLNVSGCIGSIDQTKGNRQIHIQWDTSASNNSGAGTAIVQKLSNTTVCQISDRTMSNNTCQTSNPSGLTTAKHVR
jgi:hypothetical protein